MNDNVAFLLTWDALLGDNRKHQAINPVTHAVILCAGKLGSYGSQWEIVGLILLSVTTHFRQKITHNSSENNVTINKQVTTARFTWYLNIDAML